LVALARMTILLGAMVLAAVFVIETRKRGRPILSTYLTHALANALVQFLRLSHPLVSGHP